MKLFNIKVANSVIEIQTIYDQTHTFCKDFLTKDKPELHIDIFQEDIDRERGLPQSIGLQNDASLEIQAVFRKIVNCLVGKGVLMLHGAAISVHNEGLIFTGKSGVGKTTHIMKWLAKIPDVYEINGDKPLVIADGKPMVCGSPWSGKERFYTNSMVPLKAVILLERAENNMIRQISFMEALPYLCQQISRPDDPGITRETLQLLNKISTKIKYYYFRINNFKEDCFTVAYNGIML